ncbi:MAG: ribose-phosphate diphosphokinase [Oligoflexales bacterium]
MKCFFPLIWINLLILSPGFAKSFDYSLKLREVQNPKLEELILGSQRIEDETKEFSNGNTFVRLNPSKEKGQDPYLLAKKSVATLSSSKLSANGFIELLFKISAAQKAMASKITVVLEAGSDIESLLPFRLPVKSMLAAAGANELLIGKKVHQLNKTLITPRTAKKKNSFHLAGDQHPQLRDNIAQLLGVEGLSWEALQTKNLENSTVYLVAENSFPGNTKILETMEQIYKLVSERGSMVHVITPYLPYARLDKAESEWGVAPQGALIANLLEVAGMSAITVVQAHARQSLGFFKCPAFNLSSRASIVEALKLRPYPIDLVVSPDAGFQKEATHFAQALNTPVLVLNKQREIGGEATVFDGEGLKSVEGKTLVLIDDEVSRGSTLAQASQILHQHGAQKIILAVTHLAGDAKKLLALGGTIIEEMLLTDSFNMKSVPAANFTKVSLAPTLAKHIRRLEHLETGAFQGIIDIGSSKTKVLVASQNSEQGFNIHENQSFKVPIARSIFTDANSKSIGQTIEDLIKSLPRSKKT